MFQSQFRPLFLMIGGVAKAGPLASGRVLVRGGACASARHGRNGEIDKGEEGWPSGEEGGTPMERGKGGNERWGAGALVVWAKLRVRRLDE